jgi:hypothetical protein
MSILGLAVVTVLSVTAVWLYLVIRWIDHRGGWAEHQARKGAIPRKTAPTAPET